MYISNRLSIYILFEHSNRSKNVLLLMSLCVFVIPTGTSRLVSLITLSRKKKKKKKWLVLCGVWVCVFLLTSNGTTTGFSSFPFFLFFWAVPIVDFDDSLLEGKRRKRPKYSVY